MRVLLTCAGEAGEGVRGEGEAGDCEGVRGDGEHEVSAELLLVRAQSLQHVAAHMALQHTPVHMTCLVCMHACTVRLLQLNAYCLFCH